MQSVAALADFTRTMFHTPLDEMFAGQAWRQK